MLAVQEHTVLPPSFSTPVVCLLALIALGAWVASHWLRRRLPASGAVRGAAFAGRVGVGMLAVLAVCQAAMRFHVLLTTNWPLWTLALLGAACVETLVWLYGLERKIVSRRTGAALAVLRAALVLLVIAMLTQPVFSVDLSHELRRAVAVLVDDSGSMHIADRQMTPAEKARLCQMLDIAGAEREHRLDESVARLDAADADLLDRYEDIKALGAVQDTAAVQKRLEQQREALHKAIEDARKTVEAEMLAVSKALEARAGGQEAMADMSAAKAQADELRGKLDRLLALTAEEEKDSLAAKHGELLGLFSAAAGLLERMTDKLESAGTLADEAWYASLAPEAKAKVDAATARTRIELARQAFSQTADGRDEGGVPVVEVLRTKGYALKMLRFARGLDEFDPSAASQGNADSPERQESRGGMALEEIASGAGQGKELTTAFLITDGQFTDRERAMEAARQLAAQNVRLNTVVVGPQNPPRDAAILFADAPASVYAKDKVQFKIDVKLDGLPGERARVVARKYKTKLNDTGEQEKVFLGKELAEDISVPDGMQSFEARVELTDEETDEVGMYNYDVRVEPATGGTFSGEVFTENNHSPVAVSVSDDRTKLLYIEGRPRWEFRYVKNLFSDRDPTVQMQYVLLEPDQISGVKRERIVPASASRPYGEVEATVLPGHSKAFEGKDEEFVREWLKFDVIILGDVGPKALGKRDIHALHEFVAERGGTLMVISGPRYMPHAYTGTELENLLPVLFKPIDELIAAAEAAEDAEGLGRRGRAFRFTLTEEGERHTILQQREDAEENLELWRTIPEMYWRYPLEDTKRGATVLAYAMPPKPPAYMAMTGDEVNHEVLRQREEFQRTHALVCTQKYARGRVLFLSTDRTWRLRYRIGDAYHHKFWGQAMRWAVADKLPVGTKRVRMGSSKVRYQPDEAATVEAKVLDRNLDPLPDVDVELDVYREKPDGTTEKVINRARMRPVSGSLGRYEIDLGRLGEVYGEGNYRAEIASEAVRAILREEKQAREVVLRFRVDRILTAEQKRLTADTSTLRELAAITGGEMMYPHELPAAVAALGPGLEATDDRRESSLWDSWPLMVLIVLAATAEWVIRKRSGLA